MNQKMNVKTVTFIALMSAISTVIYLVFPEIPLIPGVEHLKMDLSDLPAVLTGISFGPFSGFCVELVKNAIHLFRGTTLGVGELINLGVGTTMILSLHGFSRLLSRVFKKDCLSPAVYYAASVVTVGTVILVGWVLNAVLTPLYFALVGIPITAPAVMAGVWGSTLLNAVKAALNLLPFYPVYFALHKAFRKIYG